MNRDEMYRLLKEHGMYPVMIWADNRKSYHIRFDLNRNRDQHDCMILTEWGYIRHIVSIHLCTSEIVLEAEYGRMKVNIYYRNIDKFEVRIEEG